MPDIVLSDHFLCSAFENIHEKMAVLTTTFRSNFEELCNELKYFYVDRNKAKLSIDAEELTRLQLKHMHHAAKRRIVSEDTSEIISPRVNSTFVDL